ncbi:hypothetical protein CERSUDRAFT_118039 [Gelatoporia subvermispora B]|uniref:Zn(2)-C6 fungal-type domain-containing protein n=1 Tax=Ceriporiopsis subvermispora (strain B) TaxID=914234 RepID=M2R5P2_CERS8|nr:hypothetical protein CERSUDRAFT_118039 [Gelatoporia subvermispora B]
MAHMMPPHPDMAMQHSSLQSALQIDPNHPPPPPEQQMAPPPPSARKRRKGENGEDVPHTAEPRRLRRSHEACARCRSKKIKCDSKHPRCTACATAGTPCHQEDRHRQTLTPRGHTERIERQLLLCDALLKRRMPGFTLEQLEDICAREGVEIDYNDATLSATFQFTNSPQPGPSRPFPLRADGGPPPGSASPPRYPPYPPPGQPMMPPGYPPGMHMPYPPPPPGYGPPPMHHMGMQGPPPPPGYPHMMPPYQHPMQHPPPLLHRPSSAQDIKGADPFSHDMSSTQALARSFGVSHAIMEAVRIPPPDKEDIAVGAIGFMSGRDRDLGESNTPRDTSKWMSVLMRRNSIVAPPPTESPGAPHPEASVSVWLPKDRAMAGTILEAYFTRLNHHRPALARGDFERMLNQLYDGHTLQHDAGYICCLYLVMALGTLSELNYRVSEKEKEGEPTSPMAPKKLMPTDWPTHEEFFERALAVKPELRVTVSSLQALILLHWYLYTERQGRALWRLVGSLVRLGVELGLHHDPTAQDFSPDEAQLRIRLWAIVLVHDRGTSILLGRPLAIAPSDSNTPQPRMNPDISEHFVLSAPIAEIQADVINSLYAPTRQTADSIMRHAKRITQRIASFRGQLPEGYKAFFGGTDDWSKERRVKLVEDITADQGLTLLKIGIAKIMLLRALFNSNKLDVAHKYRALADAIVTSHNIILVHNQLIRFPDIAFFVSPVPLHIAAMVILFGHMSGVKRLSRQVAIEDVWMALDMLPSFRWRWERKDANTGHPLIPRVAEKVLNVNLHQVAPTSAPMLLPEQDWDDVPLSPSLVPAQAEQHATPLGGGLGGPQYPSPTSPFGPPRPGAGAPGGAPGGSPGKNGRAREAPAGGAAGPDEKLPDLPAGLFYPYFAEQGGAAASAAAAANGASGQEFHQLLAEAAQPMGPYGYHPHESFMLEEKDTPVAAAGAGPMWMNRGQQEQRPMGHFGPPPPQQQPPPPA